MHSVYSPVVPFRYCASANIRSCLAENGGWIFGSSDLDLRIFGFFPGVVGAGPSPLQLLLTVEVSSRGVGIGHPRSVSWDRSGTTLALGTVGNAVCLVQPGEVSKPQSAGWKTQKKVFFLVFVLTDTDASAFTNSLLDEVQ